MSLAYSMPHSIHKSRVVGRWGGWAFSGSFCIWTAPLNIDKSEGWTFINTETILLLIWLLLGCPIRHLCFVKSLNIKYSCTKSFGTSVGLVLRLSPAHELESVNSYLLTTRNSFTRVQLQPGKWLEYLHGVLVKLMFPYRPPPLVFCFSCLCGTVGIGGVAQSSIFWRYGATRFKVVRYTTQLFQ